MHTPNDIRSDSTRLTVMLFTFEINVDYQHKQAQRLGLAAVTINNLCLTETKQQCNS